MKKTLVCVLIALMVFTCTACSGNKKGYCDECGREATLHKYVLQGGFGNLGSEEYLCEDCLRLLKFLNY